MKKNELYDLKYYISDYIAPRLKDFKTFVDEKRAVSVPELNKADSLSKESTYEEREVLWSNILEKMIFPFDYYSNPDDYQHLDTDNVRLKFKEGMEIFSKYFEDLWI